ncbi:hypothetical protein PLICRDRAFT_33206 [Plicaturopsis crispa FD-325 SS-3]|uniref:Tc1-like transposase DDE domain-containing protein n=1 Tax=Plicaturopsis crispa FD-325 SS-3 TaxID=944288 RepID=A0A0C9T111_PLICR|nr:hypothetical protein PLICRDRAFT_33206 [Plicaturopsis crispa FD-325 SS-3]
MYTKSFLFINFDYNKETTRRGLWNLGWAPSCRHEKRVQRTAKAACACRAVLLTQRRHQHTREAGTHPARAHHAREPVLVVRRGVAQPAPSSPLRVGDALTLSIEMRWLASGETAAHLACATDEAGVWVRWWPDGVCLTVDAGGPSGQYVDGHEHEDAVAYRQATFLPTMAELSWNMRIWNDGIDEALDDRIGPRNQKICVVWWHDESTLYANDRHKVYWAHKSKNAVPRAKGEGASLMVADFVSADYGWLRFGDDSAQVLFKAGKAREGYFTNADILEHATKAMDILDRHRPEKKHVLVFDNATTHLKRADDALSARKMSKASGKLQKQKVLMAGGRLTDGTPQLIYFQPDHARSGIFKGMAIILEERGFAQALSLHAECSKFKCAKGADQCCCRRILFNQPDFVEVESLLETLCKDHGYQVLFLPKFHCELNFIKQCWGAAKREYRRNPPSSAEAALHENVVNALDSVKVETMRRFATRLLRFMDAYQKDGKQAAKRYRGHRVGPNNILEMMSASEITV